MIVLHELVLDYFMAGVEACEEDDIERGAAILQIALTLAEAAQESSGNHDLDILVQSVIELIATSRDLGETNPQAAAEYAGGYLPGLVSRILAYWETQE